MLHKLGYEFTCEACDEPCREDDIADFENGICHDCHNNWLAKEYAYWKPLYDGEKLAGMLPRKDDE